MQQVEHIYNHGKLLISFNNAQPRYTSSDLWLPFSGYNGGLEIITV